VPAEFVTFRLANYETPLWPVENFSAGRFNRAGEGVAQYLSLHPMTPWAELLRGEDRRTRERALLMRYPLWALRVRLDEDPVDISFDTAPDHDLAPADLVGDDHSPCQALAERLRRGGVKALTAPSAALPGTQNLVLLEPKVAIGWDLEPWDSIDLPTCMVAQDGRCPEALWHLVHYRGAGTPHPALDAWERGDDFVVEEPEVSATSLAA
jgi:RES domain-containing protein